MSNMNAEGMTWDEWLNAANCFRNVPFKPDDRKARKAWSKGHDPAEYSDFDKLPIQHRYTR